MRPKRNTRRGIVLLALSLVGWEGVGGASPPLVWEQRAGYRVARLTVPAGGHTGFTLLRPEETGIFFTNQLSYERSLANQNLLNGSGVCAGDFDGDGLPDVYFCNLEGANGLFRNLGSWKFENVTMTAGVACTNQASRGAAFADINGDGWPDLLVTSLLGPNACLLNDGQGHFKDITVEAGLVLSRMGCESLALADIDGNGTLDLYIANNGENSVLRSGGSIAVRMVGGKPQVVGRAGQRLKIVDGLLIEFGPPQVLYRNDGQCHFTPVSWTDGTFLDEQGQPLREAPKDLGLTVAFRDLNGDGFPDIYACNDFQTPDRIWLNDGQGHFRALPDLAIRTTSLFSMCVDFADIDRDGYLDLFDNDMLSRSHRLRMSQVGATNPPASQVGQKMDRQQARRNTLQLNRGDGTYAEIANYAGLDASDWTWCVAFLDVDLDGYEDVLMADGHAYDTQDLDTIEREPLAPGMSASSMRGGKSLKEFPPLLTPNYLFRNRGDRTFEEVGAAWGFNSSNVCHGLALADLDNDGDLDVIVSCLWAPPLVYRNESSAPRVAVRCKGKAPNTAGIGARIFVRGGAVPLQSQEIQCGGRYLSGDQPMRVFAAGALTNRLSIEVKWRSGLRSLITNAEPNCLCEIDEAGAAPEIRSPKPEIRNGASATPKAQFEDVSARLAHTHEEAPFNDLEGQPLLPKMLSRLGPGVGWLDLDGDGHDELVIGNGRGGALAVFKGDGKGGFARWPAASWSGPAPDDYTGLVGWVPTPGQRALLAGVSRYEIEPGAAPAVLRWDVVGGNPSAPQPAFAPVSDLLAVGPLAVADYDGDGQLDLFVGGRVAPRRYPEPVSSKLFRNQAGNLVLDEANSAALQKVGLVSGAVFSDLDGDGWPDLVLACEWGPLEILRNDHGRLASWDAPLTWAARPSSLAPPPSTLSQLTGWWSAVSAGDFDGDGRLDLVACNWGWNSSYHQPTAERPVRIYYGDFDENGLVELVEACTDPETGRVVPRRDLGFLRAGWPLLRMRFATHREFSMADVNTVLGEAASKAAQVQAVELRSMVFLNRGDHFEALSLPAEAQFAPAFAACVGDLDGDGREDVFLSQNFFAMRLEEPRLDAGRGLFLRGDGVGRFQPVPGQESGLLVYGEQRGAALGDFDEDGRADLAVSQNSGATKLYHNIGGRPGLRVRLRGPAGNPDGVGASVRLLFGQKAGPVREVHAGAGYWSQDSAVQVLGAPAPATAVWVRWPGGSVTTTPLPAGARTVEIASDGKLKAY